jgi:hypothetical protein
MGSQVKYVIDCATGEETVREMTKAELSAEEIAAIEYAETMANRQAEALAKAEAKAALFARLGISEEEAQLLLA